MTMFDMVVILSCSQVCEPFTFWFWIQPRDCASLLRPAELLMMRWVVSVSAFLDHRDRALRVLLNDANIVLDFGSGAEVEENPGNDEETNEILHVLNLRSLLQRLSLPIVMRWDS